MRGRLWRGAAGLMVAILMVGCWSGRTFVRCPGGCVADRRTDESRDAYLARYQRFNTVRHYKRLSKHDPVARWMTNRLARVMHGVRRARLKLPAESAAPTVDVIVDKEPLAFTERGGRIYISTGLLLTRARSCEEVTGVIAHELAHAIEGHPKARFNPTHDATKITEHMLTEFAEDKRRKAAKKAAEAKGQDGDAAAAAVTPMQKTGDRTKDITAAAKEVGVSPAQIGAAFGIFTVLLSVDQPYNSRVDEEQADQLARRILNATKLPARPLADFFARSASDEGACPGAFYSSHPDLRDRARILQHMTAGERGRARCTRKGKAGAKDEIDFDEIQRRLRYEPPIIAERSE